MRTINDIHTFIEFVERKETGAYHTPAQVDAALDAGQKELFKQYLDEYVNSKDKKLPTALYPFRVSTAFTASNTGLVALPADHEHTIIIYPTSGAIVYPMREVDEVELPEALNSQLRKVSTEKPIFIEGDNTIQIYPAAARTGTLVYLRMPKTPLFAFTQVGRVVTYNSAGSTQLDFDDIYMSKVIAKALCYLGVNMSEADIVNFGNVKDAQIAV